MTEEEARRRFAAERVARLGTADSGGRPHLVPVVFAVSGDRIYSVVGDVVISMLVDVDEDGRVTNAVLTGRVTKDVLKLEGAAVEAVKHWRFEPALQDGRIVPAVKIGVQMHFRGRPWRF